MASAAGRDPKRLLQIEQSQRHKGGKEEDPRLHSQRLEHVLRTGGKRIDRKSGVESANQRCFAPATLDRPIEPPGHGETDHGRHDGDRSGDHT